MAKKILAWSNAAEQFYREIGKKTDGKSPRFYLGNDEKNATANVARLEALWEGVKTRWNDLNSEGLADKESPCWDETTLLLGHAIRNGEWSVVVEPPELGTEEIAVWLGSLRVYFPMIQVQIPNPSTVEKGNRAFVEIGHTMLAREDARHQDELRQIKKMIEPYGGKVNTKETLHDALDAYKTWLEKTFVDIDKRTTQTGKKQGERTARIKRYVNDIPLSDFDIHEIDAIIEFWRTRPKKENGSPYSFTLCKHTIRLFKHFIRWLHRVKTFPWKKPVDLDIERVKIVPDTETKYKVETYSKEELGILWQFASPFERPLLMLALNCGFSISEIGRLDWQEVEGEYVRGLRPKTKVYGEFKLWPMTRQVMGTPKAKGLVFSTDKGSSLIAPTKGNNVSAKIPSAWYRLLDRVQKHYPEFKRLGFHHLRKTAANFIRDISDGETMGVFLRHGKPVKSDSLAGVYSNPAFRRVFDAQDRLWLMLEDVFGPYEEVGLRRKLEPSKVRQIRSLKQQGVKTTMLCQMFGVSPTTIRVYCRKKK